MENHEEAHILYAVRLGEVFGLRPNAFIYFMGDDDAGTGRDHPVGLYWSLNLSKAKLLDGLKVTTNRLAINELRDIVPASTEIFEEARYVDNGKIVLSARISAGMDAALYVVEKLLGEDRAIRTANLMEYD